MTDPVRTSHLLVLALWAAGLGAAGQFAKFAVLFPFLQAAYPEAGAALGFLVSLISFIGILLGLVAGVLVARIGFRRMLIGALVLGAAISAAQSALLPLPAMLGLRVLEGLSHLAIVVAAPTLIAQVTAPRDRSAALTLWGTFFGVAFAITAWLGLPLAARAGPAAVLQAHASIMAALALLLHAMLPSNPPAARRPPLPRPVALLALHREVYGSARIGASALGWLFYTLCFVSLVTVLPATVPPEARTFVAGTMPLASIAVSLTLGVALLRRMPAVNVVIAGFAGGLACLAAMAVLPGTPWPAIALFGALGLVQGASFAAVPQLNSSREAQALANGALAQTGNLGNTVGTPLLLVVVALGGAPALVLFAALSFSAGIALHLVLRQRRRRAGPV